jgi:hypothetical protein
MTKVNPAQNPEKMKSGKTKDQQLKKKSKSTIPERGTIKVDDGILVDAARKIETGSKLAGEKTADMAEKMSEQASEIAEKVYDKFRKSVSGAYHAGSKTLGDISKTAVNYVKKYEDTAEIKKLNHDRNLKMQQLGTHIFTLFKSKSRKIGELLADEETQRILKELEMLNKNIVKIGKRIKKKI